MSNLPRVMLQVACGSPTSLLTKQYILLSAYVLSLKVVNSSFWEGDPCPWAERMCESWGARDVECVHTSKGITCPQHNVLPGSSICYFDRETWSSWKGRVSAASQLDILMHPLRRLGLVRQLKTQ